MRPTRLPGRLVVGVSVSALLLGGGAFTLLGSAAAAGSCPTYTDPAGDAAPANPSFAPIAGDDDLDLLAVSQSVDGGIFTSALKVAKLSDTGPAFAQGEDFSTLFIVAGKAVVLEVVRDTSGAAPVITTTVTVAGTASSVKATAAFDSKASTITLGVTADDLAKATGAVLDGQAFSAMSATSKSWYPGVDSGTTYDTATAPATASYLFGGSCSGEAPAPVGSATPTPVGSASASPSPSASPSASPSPSGSASPSPSPTPSGSPSPTATPTGPTAPGLYDLPRKGCVAFTDPTGDADPTSTGADNEDSLDITAVNLRSPADRLQVLMKVVNLKAALLPLYSGPEYGATLTVGGKVITLTAPKAGPATATVGGKANTDLQATVALDTAGNTVIFTLPRPALEKVLGHALRAGTAVTGTTLTTAASTDLTPFPADSATGSKPAEKTYAYGDNTCFMPLPGLLKLAPLVTTSFSDKVRFTARVRDAATTRPLPGVRLRFQLVGGPVLTVKTDKYGLATVVTPVTALAGSRKVTVSYVGDKVVGAVATSGNLTVLVEKTQLTATGSRGAVTATLTDDDNNPLRYQVVVFTVGGNKTAMRTTSRGRAQLRGVPRGAVVTVSFAAVKDTYAAAKPVSGRAL